MIIAHVRGLIATHEPPSRRTWSGRVADAAAVVSMAAERQAGGLGRSAVM